MASDFSKRAFQFYIQKGYAPHQAAALAGNADWESRGGDPTAVGDKGKSRGIFQWDAGRYAGLEKFAADNNLDPKAENTQLAYADDELNNTAEKPHGDKLRAAKDLTEATNAMMGYLRPLGSNISPEASHGYTNRYNNGAELLAIPNMATALAMPPSQYVPTAQDWQMYQKSAEALAAAAPYVPQVNPAGLLSELYNPHAATMKTGMGLLAADTPGQQMSALGRLSSYDPGQRFGLPGPGRRSLLDAG